MPLWLVLIFTVFTLLSLYAAADLLKKGNKPFGRAVLSAYILYTLVFLAIWIFELSIPSYLILLTMLSVFHHHFLRISPKVV